MIQDGNYHQMMTDGNLKWLLKDYYAESFGAEGYDSALVHLKSLMPINRDSYLRNFRPSELTHSSTNQINFNQASVNYSAENYYGRNYRGFKINKEGDERQAFYYLTKGDNRIEIEFTKSVEGRRKRGDNYPMFLYFYGNYPHTAEKMFETFDEALNWFDEQIDNGRMFKDFKAESFSAESKPYYEVMVDSSRLDNLNADFDGLTMDLQDSLRGYVFSLDYGEGGDEPPMTPSEASSDYMNQVGITTYSYEPDWDEEKDDYIYGEDRPEWQGTINFPEGKSGEGGEFNARVFGFKDGESQTKAEEKIMSHVIDNVHVYVRERDGEDGMYYPVDGYYAESFGAKEHSWIELPKPKGYIRPKSLWRKNKHWKCEYCHEIKHTDKVKPNRKGCDLGKFPDDDWFAESFNAEKEKRSKYMDYIYDMFYTPDSDAYKLREVRYPKLEGQEHQIASQVGQAFNKDTRRPFDSVLHNNLRGLSMTSQPYYYHIPYKGKLFVFSYIVKGTGRLKQGYLTYYPPDSQFGEEQICGIETKHGDECYCYRKNYKAESFNSYKVAPDLSSYTKAELVSSIAGPQGTAAYDEVVYDPLAQSRLSAESIDSFSPARLIVLGASIGVALGLYNTRRD